MKITAVIPARGGSKGIPQKNIKNLQSHPLIAYSIQAAKESKYINRIICSTDSKEIAEIAKFYGAEVPFIRPSKYAGDESTDLEVFTHLTEQLEKENTLPNIYVHLRPTTPIREKGLIDRGIEKFLALNNEVDSMRAVCQTRTPPYKMWFLKDEYLSPVLSLDDVPEAYNASRHSLPPTYEQTASLDLVWVKTVKEKCSMTGELIVPYIMEQKYAVDIDDQSDFDYADFLLQKNADRLVIPEFPTN